MLGLRRALLALIEFLNYTGVEAHALNDAAHVLVANAVLVKFPYQIRYEVVRELRRVPSMRVVFLLVHIELGLEHRLGILGLPQPSR